MPPLSRSDLVLLLVKTAVGDARRNPLVTIAADAANDILTFAGQYGLTPFARSRLAAGVGVQPPGGGKFGDLLA
jgi:phage terminase small subunit